jgi:enoyl-CoA hydratase/carnithine racemase
MAAATDARFGVEFLLKSPPWQRGILGGITRIGIHLASMTTEPFPIMRETSGPSAGAAIFRLEQPGKPVVVLDEDLIHRLEATIRALPRDVTGLVLASASERVFIAGADLKTISESSDEELHRYLEYGARVFGMLSRLPYPTVAAINGAALGGGLEVAMHCDALIACEPQSRDGTPGKPYPVGLPESGLGLCPGWGGTNLLPARMDPAEAIRRTAAGQPLTFDEAKALGLFDRVAPSPDQLIAESLAWLAGRSGKRVERDGAPSRWIGRPEAAARVLASLDSIRAELPRTEAALAVAEAVDAGLSKGWEAALEVERRQLVRLRHTPAAREALAAFFARSSGKK